MAVNVNVRTKSFEGENPSPSAVFYIVSSDALQAGLITSCLNCSFSDVICHPTTLSLRTVLEKPADRQRVYLLDCLNAIDRGAIEKRFEVDSEKIPEHILVVLYNTDGDRGLASLVKRYRIRGIFYRQDSRAVLIQGMHRILGGHLWLSRTMLARCISIPAETLTDSTAVVLSAKERKVLCHVTAGESNQEIADALSISLHTVKTHLYNIYKKIHVPNRLQATLWADAHRQCLLNR
jgi:DNA-binding NarL/FixJ family response regulator